MRTTRWTSAELARIAAAPELEIAVQRTDGTLLRPRPIWVVVADGDVLVRTWHRRDTGWYGRVLASHRARIDVPGLEAEVVVEDLGAASSSVRAAVDGAYVAKYGSAGATSMVSAEAAATTLLLAPAEPPPG